MLLTAGILCVGLTERDAPGGQTSQTLAQSVNVRVIRTPGHVPAPGTTVTVSSYNKPWRTEAATESDGVARFPNLAPGDYNVVDPGTGAAVIVQIDGGETENVVLRIGDASLAGTVTRGGRPIGGAKVHLLFDAGCGSRSTIADDEGRYRFDGLAAAAATATVYEPMMFYQGRGHKHVHLQDRVDLTTGSGEKDFAIPDGRLLVRVVEDNGRAAEGVNFAVRMQNAPLSGPAADLATRSFQGNPDQFVFERLAPGLYDAAASRWDAGAGATTGVRVDEGTTATALVKLKKGGGGTVVSVVVDGTGKPDRGAWRTLTGPSGRFPCNGDSDTSGQAVMSHIPPGRYTLRITNRCYGLVERTVDVKAGETLQVQDVIRPAGQLVWELDSLSGASVLNLPCTLTRKGLAGAKPAYSGHCADDGGWTVQGVEPGDYTASVTLNDGQVLTEDVSIRADDQTARRTTVP